MYRLLIADDEVTIRNGLKKLVESYNLSIEIIGLAKNGEEALELIKQYEPEIILLDINMPFINGLEIAKYVSEHHPQTKVIIISGYNDFKYAQQAISYNVDSYLLKPIDRIEFKSVLTKAMDSYHKRLIEMNQLENDNILVCNVDDIAIEAINYLKKNYLDSELTLNKAAEDLYISNSYLSKIIKDQTGISFTDYVNQLKLETAKSLLISTNQSVNQIAITSGFNSQHYFSRAFKKESGYSPLQYRKQHNE